MTLDGKITLSLTPENYRDNAEAWAAHESVAELEKLLDLDGSACANVQGTK